LGIRGKSGARVQTFHDTIDDVALRAQELDAAEYNVYYALARFTDGVHSREATHALGIQSFFIDLDSGENKSYASPEECLTALREFLQETHFPEPGVVHSGHGIHAYWPIDPELTPAQ